MEKARKIIRSILSESIKRNTLKISGDDKPDWEPLYKFLKNIFDDKYLLAANGFMWYQTDDFEGKILNLYRNGITRKYIFIDDEGYPYRVEKIDYDTIASVSRISFEEAFKHIYQGIADMISHTCKSMDCEIPKDFYLLSYSKFSVLRDQLLNKMGYNVFNTSKEDDMNRFKDTIKENNAKYLLSPEDRKEYLAWKRKNVSFRGLSGDSEENGGGARFGTGLYTAALSNKKMSKEYGTVYYVVNAVPKNPVVFSDANQAEIWIGNTLIPMYTGKGKYPDTRKFYEMTTLRDAIMKLGYDGLVIKGREMVNYDPPHDVSYFRDESQVISYWKTTVKKDLF